tara:strand:+ start:1052 stop:1276 length:225 start_codon:yes stop_codon:yes gene_type:complete
MADWTQHDLDEGLWMSYQIVEDDNKELRKIIRGLMSKLEEHQDNSDICKAIKSQCEQSHIYNYYYLENRHYQED